MSRPGPSPSSWEAANAALLAARGLAGLAPAEARHLLALLHVGTLVELHDGDAMRRLDLGRVADARLALDGGADPAAREAAALRLLALGHREPARRLLAGASHVLREGWWAWVGGSGARAAPGVSWTAGRLALRPAAWEASLAVELHDEPGYVVLRRLRVGDATLDVAARSRPGRLSLAVARTSGGALTLSVRLPQPFTTVLVDDVELRGPLLRIELRERLELIAYA